MSRENGQFARVLQAIFSTTNWNYLPNFKQINTQCLERFHVYIITFDAAKIWPVSRIVSVWQLNFFTHTFYHNK